MKKPYIWVSRDTIDFCGDAFETLPKSQRDRHDRWVILPDENAISWRSRVSEQAKNPRLDFGRMTVGQTVRLKDYPGSSEGERQNPYYLRRVVVQYCSLRRWPMWFRVSFRQEPNPLGSRDVWIAYVHRLADLSGPFEMQDGLLSLNPDPVFGEVDPEWSRDLLRLEQGYVPPGGALPAWELGVNA